MQLPLWMGSALRSKDLSAEFSLAERLVQERLDKQLSESQALNAISHAKWLVEKGLSPADAAWKASRQAEQKALAL